MNNAQQIGARLRKLRVESGITAQQMAVKIKVSESTISKIENGRFNFGVNTMGKYAEALGVEIKIE